MTPEIKREEEDNPYLVSLETVKNVATGYGPAEVALSMVSGLPSFIVGGVHQGVEAVAPGLPEKIGLKQASEFLARPEIIYQPKTQAGQALQRTIALPFELARETGPKVADWVQEKTGSPLLATGAGTVVSGAPEILMGILGLKAMAKGPSPYPVTPPGLITRMPEGTARPAIPPSSTKSPMIETLGSAYETNPYDVWLEKPMPPKAKVGRAELFDLRKGTPELETTGQMLEPLRQKNVLTEPESRVNVAQKNIMETPELLQEVRHYMPPSEWMKVPELSRDAQLAAKKVGVKPENLEYVGLQKFTPYSQDAMHMWQVVDETSPFFQSTIAGPTFQLPKGGPTNLLKSEKGSLQLGTPIEQPQLRAPIEQPPPFKIIESNTYRGQRKTSLFGPDDGMLVAKDTKGNDIGYLWYTKKPEGFTVNKIEVAPKSRRQGVATSLLQQAESEMGPSLGATTAQTPEGVVFQKGYKMKKY